MEHFPVNGTFLGKKLTFLLIDSHILSKKCGSETLRHGHMGWLFKNIFFYMVVLREYMMYIA